MIFMAAIRPCIIETTDSISTQYYSKLGTLEVLDISCIRGVVGRIKLDRVWAIIDRTGRAHPVADIIET